MRSRLTGLVVAFATVLVFSACQDRGVLGSADPTVSVTVAPYELPLMSDACYTLSVFDTAVIEDMNATSLIWTQPSLCASDYGAQGGIRFTGICDAQAGGFDDNGAALDPDHNNAVMLVLNDLYTGGEWDGDGVPLSPGRDYVNPCPEVGAGQDNGCILRVPCTKNQDHEVLFNLMVMRDAQLGFFDTVVRFQDVFCAAKLDCVDDDNTTLTYLHDDNATPPGDGPTAVLGFACLGGDGGAISMYLDDLVVTCSTGSGETRSATVNPAGGPGNLSAPDLTQSGASDVLFGAAVNVGEGFQGARFWNVLLGLNLPGVHGETCTLHTTGSVSETALDDSTTPANTRYPLIDWTVDLTEDGNRTCARHPLNGPDGGVETRYTRIDSAERFDHALSFGVACPCWGQGAPGAMYLGQFSSLMTGEYAVESGYYAEGDEYFTYAYVNAQVGEMALLTGYSLNDTDGAGVGLYCMVIGQLGAEQVEYALQPISPEEVAACLAGMAELLDDPCRVNNGECGSAFCLYVGPGERICGECRTDTDCPGGQLCSWNWDTTTTVRCVDCYDDCSANGQVCDASTHQCVTCLTADDCTGAQLCNDAGQCLDCLSDGDCADGSACDASGQCVVVPPPGPAAGFDVTSLSTAGRFTYQGDTFFDPYPLVVATDLSGHVVGHYYPPGLAPSYAHALTLCPGESLAVGTPYRLIVMTNAADPCAFTPAYIDANDWTWDEHVATALTSIDISPADAILQMGNGYTATATYVATGHYSDGATVTPLPGVTWTSGDPGIASIAGAIATTVGDGTVTITASAEGVSAQTSLTVIDLTFDVCATSDDCTNLARPHCDPAALRCVECLSDTDCSGLEVCEDGRCDQLYLSAATSWDLDSAFPTSANPNGVWRYGWTQTLGAPFHFGALTDFMGVAAWVGPAGDDGGYPVVFHNTTTSTLYGAIPPGVTVVHPGPGNERGVVRWRAPGDGAFLVNATFTKLHYGSTDVWVLVNSVPVFGPTSTGQPTTYSATLTLQHGDALDFVVGFGSDMNFQGDSTGVDVTITAP